MRPVIPSCSFDKIEVSTKYYFAGMCPIDNNPVHTLRGCVKEWHITISPFCVGSKLEEPKLDN